MATEMKLLLPDCCWNKGMVSGALFLYFQKDTIGFTLHPSVSTFMTGADPPAFFRFVEKRRPSWAPKFFKFVQLWRHYNVGVHDTGELLSPLHGKAFKTIWLSYPRGVGAWESAAELLASSTLPQDDIARLIDPYSAADELFSHVFFEKFLELYYGHLSTEELVAMGSQAAKSGSPPPKVDVDWSPLYEYCNECFGLNDLDELLTTAYMFRMPLLRNLDVLLLTNEGLIPFLASLPIEPAGKLSAQPGVKAEDALDPVAWEFFRQLVSPILDPIDESRIRKISQLADEKAEEIERLKSRCLALAHQLGDETNLETLQRRIRDHVKVNVQDEVQAVTELDRSALSELFKEVFSDDKTWLGISGLLYSLLNGGPILTAGSAICALSVFGSKAFKAAATKREKLKASDYALLYRMKHL